MSAPLISAEALRADPARYRVVDCSHDLMDAQAGPAAFAQGHIPGAVHAHLDRALSGPKTGRNGRHPLPASGDLVHWLGQQGIMRGDAVVAYDRTGGSYAARLWWLLRWLGQDTVQVLDGGWQAWCAAGGAVSTEAPAPTPVVWGVPTLRASLSVDVEAVLRNLATQEFLVVDARGAERYRGDNEPIDPRAGHIPGAANRPFPQNLGADGRFKPAEVLRQEWQAVLGQRDAGSMVAQCGSGVTACHNLLALELAGMPGARLYPGSWSEWCSDPQRPVETGTA